MSDGQNPPPPSPAGSNTAPTGSGDSTDPVDPNGDYSPDIAEAQENCFDIIEQFRRGDINKTVMLFQVTQSLSAVQDVNPESFESALDSFYRTIDEVALEKTESAK